MVICTIFIYGRQKSENGLTMKKSLQQYVAGWDVTLGG